MARVYDKAYVGDGIVPIRDAHLSVASSAVLYGLSVYTVFPVEITSRGRIAFRLREHYERLVNSSRIIGIDTFESAWSYERFEQAVKDTVSANDPKTRVFVRATVHVDELVAGTRSRGLHTTISMFIYEALPILPQDGARLKTSVWRRTPDYAIPARAKVNGAYVNSVLAKQDAIDSGYDDCILLDATGHVCELSAANIFIVRDGVLITPDNASDILEGISRRTLLELAHDMKIPTMERAIDLTELYIADEIFACGTSAVVATVKEVDARMIGTGSIGSITTKLREKYMQLLGGELTEYAHFFTVV